MIPMIRAWVPGALAFALAGAISGCGPKEKVIVVHPEGSDAARDLFRVAMLREITLPDNFVLRPDEFAAVTVDHERDVIYVGSRAGDLLALDHVTGDVVWEMNLGGAVSSRPVLADMPGDVIRQNALLLVGTDNGEMVAIDLDSRQVSWRYHTDGKIRNAALTWEGVVYFVNSRDQVFALDVRSGDWRWQYEQELQTDFTINGHAGLTFVPAAADQAGDVGPGTLYTGFDNGKVVAIGAGTGEALWISSVAPAEGGAFSDCDSTPLVDVQRQELVVAGQQTGVYALSLTDGTETWRFPVRGSSTVVRGRGTDLVAASSLEGVFALDRQGLLLWRTQVDPGVLSEPVVVDDTVYVTHSADGLLAFDAETGAYLLRIDPGSGMSSVPVYDPVERRFWATTNRGLLIGLEVEPAYPELEPLGPTAEL